MPMYMGFLPNDKYVTKNKTRHKIIVGLKDEFNETAKLLLCIKIAKYGIRRRVHTLFDVPPDVRTHAAEHSHFIRMLSLCKIRESESASNLCEKTSGVWSALPFVHSLAVHFPEI